MADIRRDYYLDGKFISDKNIFYYKDGVLHREDGLAVEYASGRKKMVLSGQIYKLCNSRTFC